MLDNPLMAAADKSADGRARYTTEPGAAIVAGEPRFPDCAGGSATGREQQWRQLVQTHGPAAAARRIAGSFCVAITLDDGSVFLAVDRFASRPLCYSIDARGLRVAMRADAFGSGAADVDPQAIFDYLYFHVVPSPRTIFVNVRRLPPGHCALFRNGELRVERYWIPEFKSVAKPSFAALKDEFRSLLHTAVRRQLDGSQPACFLSGGTDSSSVAGLISEVAGRPPATYSIGFDAEGYDEMHYARIAAKAYRTEHHEYYVTPKDLVDSIDLVASSFDQPFGNSSALPAYHCALRAAGDGVTRLLAGDGGDELFGGNSRYATQRIFDRYKLVPPLLRRALLEPFFSIGIVSRTVGLKKGSNYIRQANTPLPGRGQEFNLLRRLGYAEVLSPALLAAIDPASVLGQQDAVWQEVTTDDEINKHLAYDWRYTLAENDLPKVVGATSLAGVGVGFPLLDDDLVDFSMRLPAEYKLKGLTLRWFFKEALRGFLPNDIITKKKHGFGLPVGPWLVQHEGLRRLALDAIYTLSARGIVRPEFLHTLVKVQLPQAPHYYGTIVWVLVMLEHWLRARAPDYRLDG